MKLLEFLGKNRDDKSMFHDKDENELVNAFIALGVVMSIFIFPYAYFGLIAVATWMFLAYIFFKRGYAPFSTLLVGIVTIVLIGYQINVTIVHINEQRGMYDYVELSPEIGSDYQEVHYIDVNVKHEEEVFSIFYQFQVSKGYQDGEWVFLEGDVITTEGLDRGSYYLIVRVDLISGIDKYYTVGRYYVE